MKLDCKNWKQLHLMKHICHYGTKAEYWRNRVIKNVYDDRTVYVNIYDMIKDVFESLPDELDPWLCGAIIDKLHKEEEVLDSILKIFEGR